MNLFDFLNKFGSRHHFYEICIENDSKLKYKLRIYKSGLIVTIGYGDGDEKIDANLDNGKIKIYINGRFHIFIIPPSFDYFIGNDKYSLYIPQNDHNVKIYNKLLKRRDIEIDSRFPNKSKWRHFKHLKLC